MGSVGEMGILPEPHPPQETLKALNQQDLEEL
jgi:hypothetical protein